MLGMRSQMCQLGTFFPLGLKIPTSKMKMINYIGEFNVNMYENLIPGLYWFFLDWAENITSEYKWPEEAGRSPEVAN